MTRRHSEEEMARPNLFAHRKFFHLASILGAQYRAVGVLEMIWRLGYESGDANVGPADAVEAAVGWDGERGVCATALVATGFLDQQEDGCLLIHDLDDHAPDYVKARARMERKRELERNSYVTVPNNSEQLRNCYATPTPTPTPTPIEECSNEHSLGEVDYPEDFSAFWEAYPRKVAKLDALKAWKTTKRKRPAVDAVVAKVEALAGSEQWTKDGGQYAPYPASWLRAGGWDDEVSKRSVTSAPPKLVSAGAHTPDANPWSVDDIREFGGDPPKHPRWDDYIDDMACKPGQWPRFADWLAQREVP